MRFIEFMPIGNKESWDKARYIGTDDLKNIIADLGTLEPEGQGRTDVEGNKDNAGVRLSDSRLEGPARVYRLTTPEGKSGRVGFISPISHHFCDKCNRLRLTSEGRLRACLLHDHETDLKALLRQGATDGEIQAAIRQTILAKPKGHTLQDALAGHGRVNCQGRMSQIGG